MSDPTWGALSLAYDVPSIEPTTVTAGDTWTWTRAFTDYPVSEGWALSYAFISLSDSTAAGLLTWDAGWVTDDGAEYTIEIPAASTAAKSAGTWRWMAFVTLSGDRHTAAEGVFTVLPNLATATAGSQVSHAEATLALVRTEIRARLSGTAGSGHNDYTIGDRSISKFTLQELRDLEAAYAARVERKRTGTVGRRIEYRFMPTT